MEKEPFDLGSYIDMWVGYMLQKYLNSYPPNLIYLPNAIGRPPWNLCMIKKLADHSRETQRNLGISCDGAHSMNKSKRITGTLSMLMR